MQSYKFFDIHTHKTDCQSEILAIHNVRYGVDELLQSADYHSVGVHPYDARLFSKSDLNIDFEDQKLVAIGEIGLDLRPEIFAVEQYDVFEKQLEIAKNANLPVIIHCVRAHEEVLRILKHHDIEKAIFHGFNSGIKNAQKIIDSRYALSFGVKLLNNNELQGLFKVIYDQSSGRFFLETDESPVGIEDIYNCAASICGIELLELSKKIKVNVREYFGKI